MRLIFRLDDEGTMSRYENIGLRIYQDGSKRIDIQGIEDLSFPITYLLDMANLDEFLKEFGGDLSASLHTGQLEHVLDLWHKFLDICRSRADSKLQEWDDIF